MNKNDNLTKMVLRGGSWFMYPVGCRSAVCDWVGMGNNIDDIGLRVVREWEEIDEQER